MSSKPARKFSDAELCANFLDQLRSRGFHTVQAEVLDPRARNNFVPSASQDQDTQDYIASISGKDGERAVVYEFEESDIADLSSQDYALDAIAEEIAEAPPAPLAVVLHVSNRHGEYIHSVSDSGKVTFCWDKKSAGRVALDDVARIEQHLAAHGVEALAEWA
jgi:hypothetical protein